MLKDLVIKNRSCRGYDNSKGIKRETLLSFVDLARICPAKANHQALRYRLVTDAAEVSAVQRMTRWGMALPELHLPYPGQEAPAFIVLCLDTAVAKRPADYGVDVGIAAQTMALAAAEAGYACLMIESFDRKGISETLKLPEGQYPALCMAFGVSKETAVLEEIGKDGSTKYYRDAQGVHHVPKRRLEDVLL
ncbi:MAG: nitroreductase family protein [Clostridia bacterium]|nr:nitroreductase family protein [Clostridia bacterium]